ncbi:MAG TPA: NAD-dependent epimerase/dehydratase family protein [Pirellulales bacterium]|jgi:nucleoside-diphosphate-sugar epimerase|nr:NAD-dependent epimerase/dehydratase family protein [Pirellulales bacterium]
MSTQRTLITGASGFIGACLARDLIAGGHEVHVVLRKESPRWRLAGLEGEYAAHEADLRDLPALRRAVEACRPDVIYHLAAQGTLAGQHDRAAVFASNLAGTCHLLEALAAHDYLMLVQAGSSSEYGHYPRAMREDDRLQPRTDYAVSKAASTLLVQAEFHKGRPVTTVRIFSAYGPWEDPGRLMPYLMSCCLSGQRPQVTDGRQPRDFIHVDDCVALLKRAAACPGARGQILHAGTGRRQTVRGMVGLVLRLCTGGRLSADFGSQPSRADEPAEWVADIRHTTAVTGWRPEISPEEGVLKTWNWHRAEGASRNAA